MVKHESSATEKPMASTVWFTDSLMNSAEAVGNLAMRRANSTVQSDNSSSLKTLLTMPRAYASSAPSESPVSRSSLALRGPNSHGWPKTSTPHMPSRVPTTSANTVSSPATIRSQHHASIRPADRTIPWTSAMVILRRFRHRLVLAKK